jgi:hypothetical protein
MKHILCACALAAAISASAALHAADIQQLTQETERIAQSGEDFTMVSPLAPDAVKPMAQAIMAGFKPGIAGMLGSFGQGIEIIMYPGRKDGKLLLDPLQPGGFKYTLFDQTFTWRLPLGSLLPPLHDPKTGEEFPGNYLYNPFTGTKLSGK